MKAVNSAANQMFIKLIAKMRQHAGIEKRIFWLRFNEIRVKFATLCVARPNDECSISMLGILLPK